MNGWLILEKTIEQLWLALSATTAATFIGIPLGILVAKKPFIKRFVIGIVNTCQTIPSLALLAFLLPFFGIGFTSALITLTLYALLPIVGNTQAALENLPEPLIEAADSLGFTSSEKLRIVELPLAFPFIITGIRTAAVMSVGIATIASFIGAGGLGDFIFQGISTNNTSVVMTGAIPAALLALSIDFLLGKVETISYVFLHRFFKRLKRWGWALLLLCGIGGWLLSSQTQQERIVIGTKISGEQSLIGELIAQTIEAHTDLKVVRKFNLGTSKICHDALVNGEIDLYTEYTGTGYLHILKHPYKQMGKKELFALVNKEYQVHFNAQWLPPLGYNNTYALIIPNAFASKYALSKISDLKAIESKVSIAVLIDFYSREDGFQGLSSVYNLTLPNVKQMAHSLMFQALDSGGVNVATAFSVDGRLDPKKYTVLEDDRHLFPPYEAAIVIRNQTLLEHPEVREVLYLLSGKIDDAEMQQMNREVEIEKKTTATVARTFLETHNLL